MLEHHRSFIPSTLASQSHVHGLSAGPLLVEGSLTQFPGGEVEVSFDSDRSRANYQCVLLEQATAHPPTVIPCKIC